MKALLASVAAATAVLILAPTAAAAPRPLVCQLLDLGLRPETVRLALAAEDLPPGAGVVPSGGSYTSVYYTTIARSCPEYCDGYEC